MNRNFDLEIKKLLLKKQNVELSRATLELRLAEMEDEKARLSENFPLYDIDIVSITKEIADLETAKKAQN